MKATTVLTYRPTIDDLKFDPICMFIVGSHGTDSQGNLTLSPELINAQEIDYWADSLISDINTARQEAKRSLGR
jgi:hypothetical protein